MNISPRFFDHTVNARRVSFQFGAQGTKQCGVLYVTMNVEGDPMAFATKAAKIAAKRAGADTVTLHAIVNPMR